MFTGIIEETGIVKSFKRSGCYGEIVIKADKVLSDSQIGDSIAVNGICLTVKKIESDGFSADVMSETVAKTSLSKLTIGSRVNLERAMPVNGRFGGHIVSGHIDGVGIIESLKKDGNAVWISIRPPKEILNLIVCKGSITIDGISLTVACVDNEMFKVSIIPHTWENTSLFAKKPGDSVNLENDIIGKYIEKLLNTVETKSNGEDKRSGRRITTEYLREHGF